MDDADGTAIELGSPLVSLIDAMLDNHIQFLQERYDDGAQDGAKIGQRLREAVRSQVREQAVGWPPAVPVQIVLPRDDWTFILDALACWRQITQDPKSAELDDQAMRVIRRHV